MLKDALLKLFKLDGLVNTLTGYVEARIELLKYEIKEDMAKAIARLSLVLLTAIFFTFFMLFLSISVAIKIGEALGTFAGFGIVSGFYLLLMLIIIIFRSSISKIMEDKIKENITHPSVKTDVEE
jgi:uncharacterized membrane protein YqjE